MSLGGTAAARRSRSGWSRTWQVLALIVGLYVVEQDTEALLWSTRNMPGAGTIRIAPNRLKPAPDFAPGYVTVIRIEPGSPLARIGVSLGDHLSFDHTGEWLRYPRVGEVFGLTIDHAGRKVRREVVAVPRKIGAQDSADVSDVYYELANLIPCLIGAVSRGEQLALLNAKLDVLLIGRQPV